MAHFARVEPAPASNLVIVREVIAVNNDALGNESFPQSEELGQKFISSLGLSGEWLQTSYNANFRGKFAGINDLFDGVSFIPQLAETAVEP